MSYSVTGIRAAPDSGFRGEHRRTAEGARQLATTFLSEGLREVEIRDGAGNLKSMQELETATEDMSFSVVARLSAL